jgi:hypothetical protein
MRGRVDPEQLECPGCGARHDAEKLFCPDCKLPLVFPGAEQQKVSERQERARKIKPQFAEGELVRVVGARNQVEGEFIQGLLLEEGVPSLLKRSAGFDVPDFLAAGPRDVFVASSGLATAREVLLQAEIIAPGGPSRELGLGVDGGGRPRRSVRWLAALLVALFVAAFVVWLLGTVLH